MRLATLLLEFETKLAGLTLHLEDDVIERFERERRRRLRSDIACLENCGERQELRAAIGRCRESETKELCEILDRDVERQQFERSVRHSHLRC